MGNNFCCQTTPSDVDDFRSKNIKSKYAIKPAKGKPRRSETGSNHDRKSLTRMSVKTFQKSQG